jgi:hypothetical protein
MTRDLLTTLSPCTLRLAFSPDLDQGLAFTAFSARFPKRSVENQMPNGKWHGVFTYALLNGLRGAAANAGTVTTRSLKDYLIGNMRSFMHIDDQNDPEVSKEPDFGRDDSFELAQLQTPAVNGRVPFTLRFQPEAVGRRAVISKNLRTEVAATVLDQRDWQIQIDPGIYSISVEGIGYPVAFQVVGGGVDAPFNVV